MREIRTSGSMSGERKRSDAAWPKPPRLSSTLLPQMTSKLVEIVPQYYRQGNRIPSAAVHQFEILFR